MTDSLTICTVSYRSASLLDLNLTLTRELNPAANFHWLIVDNNNDFQGHNPLALGEKNVQVIQGDPCINQGLLKGSYHHAQALNKALSLVSTRYLLVIDPDFFIFQKDWVNTVLKYMSDNNLSFWGAPYYPNLTWKRRYFPTVSCMLIDLEKVAPEKLDFTPELDEFQFLKASPTLSLLGIIMGIIPYQVRHVDWVILLDIVKSLLRIRWVAEPLSALLPKRFYTNTDISRDTGFKIQNFFGKDRTARVETLLPSYVNDLFTKKDSFFLNIFARLYSLLVPENLSIYPKRRNYSTTMSFKDIGLFDVRGQFGWEEFFWKEKPFAMHIKGGTRKFEDVGYDKLQAILRQLAEKPV
ncbi:MAG: hypothetical protein J0M11_07535 [Anaerolineae bacterium]|nr:hypothetical protein [Anaerolineae bacterium]